MDVAGLDLNLLVTLRALLVEANLTRAGQSIAMSQSSMSVALSRLRGHFKDELLVRVGRDYELTPLGRQLLPQVQLALSLVEKALVGESQVDPTRMERTFTIMASDFAMLELKEAFVEIQGRAPGVSIEVLPLPENPTDSNRDLINTDFIAAVPGIGIDGDNAVLFVDHYVCLLDSDNPRLIDGELSWEAFTELPQAVAFFGKAHVTPAGRRLRELGFHRAPTVSTSGFLPLPAVVGGTDLVAVVPSRLVDRFGSGTGTVAVPTPFGQVEIVETLWWHPSHNADAGHTWFRDVLLGTIAGRATAGQVQ